MNVVHLPPVKVRYSYSTPSMSRRGGTRLHPIKDGTAPMGEQLFTLRHRDKSGQKLRDVVHPVTGYCIAVTSPLEGPVSGKGTSGSPTAETKRASVTKAEVRGHKVYLDEDGFVCRTLEDGDSPRPVAYATPTAPPKKERRVGKTTGGNGAKRSAVGIPGGTGPGGSITDSDCEALIRVMSKGRKVTITKAMMAQAKEIIKQRRKAAQKVLGGK